MTFKETLLKYLHKIYRKSEFLNAFLEAVQTVLDKIQTVITRLEFLLHFNKLDTKGCEWWENLLKITDIATSLDDRRAKIRAKFLACTHNDITLLQKVCDSWKNGEIVADFVSGKIQLTFIGEYGIPDALDLLKNSINETKPAHLDVLYIFRYLLIEDIHEVKTIEQMEQITLEQFAFGNEGE